MKAQKERGALGPQGCREGERKGVPQGEQSGRITKGATGQGAGGTLAHHRTGTHLAGHMGWAGSTGPLT